MILTKFGHSCVLIDTQVEGKRRVALFDPGVWSTVDVNGIDQLDYLFISHVHGDHCSLETIMTIVDAFPQIGVSAPAEVVQLLHDRGVLQATTGLPTGAVQLAALHEEVQPLGVAPEQLALHWAGAYTHPGDSHSFTETMPVLALPIVAPWGSTRRAAELALQLKPQYVVPVHDWFLSKMARDYTYGALQQVLTAQDITLLEPRNGRPIEIDI